MKPARLVGVISGIVSIVFVSFVYTQRSYLHFIVPEPIFAVAQFVGTFRDSVNSAWLLSPAATGTSLTVAGSVGIGTTSPQAQLHLYQATAATIYGQRSDSTIPNLSVYGLGTSGSSITYGSSLAEYNGGFRFYTDSTPTDTNNNLTQTVTIDSSGNVGIGAGATSPQSNMDIIGSPMGAGNFYQNNLRIADTTAIAKGVGGGIDFTGKWSGTNIADYGAGIRAFKMTATDVDTAYGMLFWTRSAGGPGGPTNAMFIDDAGRVGIGTTKPPVILSVMGTLPLSLMSTDWATSNGSGLRAGPSGTGNVYSQIQAYTIGGDSTGALVLNPSGGNVGIGTTSPSVALHVVGNARITAIGSGAFSARVEQTSDGTLTTSTSDVRFKKDIRTIDNALDKVMRLRGVTFNWKDPSNPKRMTGMIAQEVLPVMPELVYQNPVDGYYGLFYGQTDGLFIEAIKQQQGEIASISGQLVGLSLTDTGDLKIEQTAGTDQYTVRNTKTNSLVSRISAFAELVVGNMRAGIIETKKLIVDGIDVAAKLSELSRRIDTQDQTIRDLQAEIKQLQAQ